MKNFNVLLLTLISLGLFVSTISAYPIDGYAYTGIKRLAFYHNQFLDTTQVSKLDPGALWMMEDIQLSLVGKNLDVPSSDDELQKAINRMFSGLEPQYSISLLDISNPDALKYASKRENTAYQPGSVGKLAVLLAVFSELEKIYGDDWESIRRVLYTKQVKGGPFAVPNHHTVPFYDIEKDQLTNRHVVQNDVFSLYEWLDHMVSKSSNAAASICWREAVLLRAYDRQYECINQEEVDAFFDRNERGHLSDIAIDLVNCPLRELEIEHDEWRLGSFFTSGSDRYIPGQGGSTGTTLGLTKFLLALEQGKAINERSSLEMKRIMYLTDRRIRYAASKSLDSLSVCFKSGSFYSFKPEPGFVKAKYAGNRFNYMNSVALIENKEGTKRYIVALMSNVLRKNSVREHYGLAYQIERLMQDGLD